MSANPYDIPGMAGGETPGGDPLTRPSDAGAGEARKNRYKSQMARANIALALLFASGAAVIYGLSLRKGPAEASAEQQVTEAQVDSAILRLSAAPVDGSAQPAAGRVTRELLKNFCAEVRDRQIPANALRKDPFVFVPPPSRVPAATAAKAAPAQVAAPTVTPAQTLAEVKRRLKTLEVQSIMMSPHGGGTAIISNNLLTAGQRIEGFTVKSIQAKAVTLTWKDQTFTLEMLCQE